MKNHSQKQNPRPLVSNPKDDNDFMTQHHLIPRVLGGETCDSNLMRLWYSKHRVWHKLFKNRSLQQVILLLSFNTHEAHRLYELPCWKSLFKDKTVYQVIDVLNRLHQRKRSLF